MGGTESKSTKTAMFNRKPLQNKTILCVLAMPIGFIMSAVALYFLEARKKISLKTFVVYACMSGVVITGASAAGWTYLNGGSASHHEHGKDHAH